MDQDKILVKMAGQWLVSDSKVIIIIVIMVV